MSLFAGRKQPTFIEVIIHSIYIYIGVIIQEVNQCLVNGLFRLLINGLYIGVN